MDVTPTRIPGVVIITPRVFGDERGFFEETWHQQRYTEAGLPAEFVQVNHSRSAHNVLRCLLYTSPSPRDKRQSRMPSSA